MCRTNGLSDCRDNGQKDSVRVRVRVSSPLLRCAILGDIKNK